MFRESESSRIVETDYTLAAEELNPLSVCTERVERGVLLRARRDLD
jgi:hypothetical protein